MSALASLTRRLRDVIEGPPAPIDEWLRMHERVVRFTSAIDDEAERFENELLERPIVPCRDEIHGLTSEHGVLSLPLEQRVAWARCAGRELRLMQIRDPEGRAAMQAIVYVKRPRRSPWTGHAVAPRLGHAASGAEEQWGLSMLRTLCAAGGDITRLRLQPRRLGVHALCDVETRARRAGFRLTDPEGVTRTLLLDLRASGDELAARLSRKTRKKLRARDGAPIEIRALRGTRHLDACKRAALASVQRHGADASHAPLLPMLRLAAMEPTRVRALGLFLASRPDEPVAFVTGQRYGEIAEYLSAGSLDDPELRKHPFNYWLLWELAEWARESGARYLDLGGLSDAGPDDPLAGIDAFKRHFTTEEAEVGREMIATLQPAVHYATYAARKLLRVAMAR